MPHESLCTICQHEHRRDIERAATATSERKAAHEFGVSRDALHRHLAKGHAHRPGLPSNQLLQKSATRPTVPAMGERPTTSSADEPQAELPEHQAASAPPDPPTEESLQAHWVNIIADTIALGRYNGRETIVAIAQKAGVEHVVVQGWAKQAARRVEASWGNAEQRWQVSLAEWRRQLVAAQEAKDLRAAGVAQAGIDKLMASMPKRTEAPADDETAVLHKTPDERRRHLIELFRHGRFHGLQTAGHLALAWDDLGPFEFSELVTSAAAELNFRRGSDQARRVALIGILERCVWMALKQEDPRTAARLAEVWAKVDCLTVEQDLQTAAQKHEAMRIIASVLQRHPNALAEVHAAILAEDSRKRAVLAPSVVIESDHAAE